MSLARAAAKTVFAAADHLVAPPPGPRVLIYHQVGSGLGRQMEVDLDDFERQIAWLHDCREVVDLETAISRWQEPGSQRLVVLTFDDGYRDTYTTAFPRLRDLGMPFTLYIATESVDSGRSLGPGAAAEPLTWEMIGEMAASGLVTIGAHTHTHRDLRSASEEVIEEELSVSNRLVLERVGVEPDHFAYPWGYTADVAEAMVQRTYSSAVLGGSPKPLADPSPYRIHRYPVQLSDGFRFFKARVEGGLRLEEWVRRRLRGYTGP